ncbi:hypothetical protein GQ53DRAFT_643295, partial [Thozetella sp. PMI_491]
FEALADPVMQYEERAEWGGRSFPWNLEPSAELDEVWSDFLWSLNVRVSEDEMDLLNETRKNRVRVTGGGYAATMGVTHQMHCLNNLRRLIHWDHYQPRLANMSTHEASAFTKEHSDHCIDSIRQSLMCKANTNMYMLEWPEVREGESRPELPSQNVVSHSTSTCVNWDLLDAWARKRALIPGHFHYLWVPTKPMHD